MRIYSAVIKGVITVEDARRALATVFRCPLESVLALDELTEEKASAIDFGLNIRDGGDFRSVLSASVEDSLLGWGDSLKFGQALAKALEQPLLTDATELTDAPSEAFSALIEPDGSTFLVVEDEDDEGNRIILEDTIRPAERIR